MRRWVPIGVAVAALLLPALSAFGHTENGLRASFHEGEVVVTGHEALDPKLHIEGPSGVRDRHCPECVLDKRQAREAAVGVQVAAARSADHPVPTLRFDRGNLDLPRYRSPRAPPQV